MCASVDCQASLEGSGTASNQLPIAQATKNKPMLTLMSLLRSLKSRDIVFRTTSLPISALPIEAASDETGCNEPARLAGRQILFPPLSFDCVYVIRD